MQRHRPQNMSAVSLKTWEENLNYSDFLKFNDSYGRERIYQKVRFGEEPLLSIRVWITEFLLLYIFIYFLIYLSEDSVSTIHASPSRRSFELFSFATCAEK